MLNFMAIVYMDNMYTGDIGHMVFVCVTSAELDELCVLTTTGP